MPRGGERRGAGRPKGTGPYAENTTPMRVPNSLKNVLKLWFDYYAYCKAENRHNPILEAYDMVGHTIRGNAIHKGENGK